MENSEKGEGTTNREGAIIRDNAVDHIDLIPFDVHILGAHMKFRCSTMCLGEMCTHDDNESRQTKHHTKCVRFLG